MEESNNEISYGRVEISFQFDTLVKLKVYPEIIGVVKDIRVNLRSGVVEYLIGFYDRDEWKYESELEHNDKENVVAIPKYIIPNKTYDA